MTDLQIAVTAGAAIVLLWVLAVNLRDWSRIKKRLDQQSAPVDEPLFSGQQERALAPTLPSDVSEAIAVLRWQTPMAVSRIQQELRGWRHVGSKPLSFAWISQGSEALEPEPAGEKIQGLQVGVLLATRSGPLHAMEYSEWQDVLGRVARNLGAQLEVPSMTDVLSKARQLDQQCASADAQLTVLVTSSQVLSSTEIASAAQAAGLEPRGESRYAMGPLHHQRFSVFPGDAGNSLVLMLDLPRTADPVQAFQEMVAAADAMASMLSAEVTDESGRLLPQEAISQIASQVAEREERLLALGIIPGSTVAQKLFL